MPTLGLASRWQCIPLSDCLSKTCLHGNREVELRAHGQGGAYGCPADCWSLGAVLHVMLVAKFPSFDVVRYLLLSSLLIYPNNLTSTCRRASLD
jgi:hypothetical protein